MNKLRRHKGGGKIQKITELLISFNELSEKTIDIVLEYDKIFFTEYNIIHDVEDNIFHDVDDDNILIFIDNFITFIETNNDYESDEDILGYNNRLKNLLSSFLLYVYNNIIKTRYKYFYNYLNNNNGIFISVEKLLEYTNKYIKNFTNPFSRKEYNNNKDKIDEIMKLLTRSFYIMKYITESTSGGSLYKSYLTFKTKDGKQIKKKIYMIKGKPKVRDGKINNKINYISLSSYKKKYSK